MIRPYEFPRAEYGFWYEVGQLLGLEIQALVEDVICQKLCRGILTMPAQLTVWEPLVRAIAQRRGLVLF
jgi:hypothetical protein